MAEQMKKKVIFVALDVFIDLMKSVANLMRKVIFRRVTFRKMVATIVLVLIFPVATAKIAVLLIGMYIIPMLWQRARFSKLIS